jgi:hypothetical protein
VTRTYPRTLPPSSLFLNPTPSHSLKCLPPSLTFNRTPQIPPFPSLPPSFRLCLLHIHSPTHSLCLTPFPPSLSPSLPFPPSLRPSLSLPPSPSIVLIIGRRGSLNINGTERAGLQCSIADHKTPAQRTSDVCQSVSKCVKVCQSVSNFQKHSETASVRSMPQRGERPCNAQTHTHTHNAHTHTHTHTHLPVAPVEPGVCGVCVCRRDEFSEYAREQATNETLCFVCIIASCVRACTRTCVCVYVCARVYV